MTPVIWTPPALRDVARLHAFLAPKNRDAARSARSARFAREYGPSVPTLKLAGRSTRCRTDFASSSSSSAAAATSRSIVTMAAASQSWPCVTAEKLDIERPSSALGASRGRIAADRRAGHAAARLPGAPAPTPLSTRSRICSGGEGGCRPSSWWRCIPVPARSLRRSGQACV